MPFALSADDQYSPWTGLVYIFNLIVGTGALTLPASFLKAGWGLGAGLIVILAFVSFITATFVLEALSCANFIVRYKRMRLLSRVSHRISRANQINQSDTDDEVDESNEDAPLFTPTEDAIERFPSQPRHFYSLNEKLEMSDMSNMFFGRLGQILFFLCFAIYLYGDLAIYTAVVSKSLSDVICTYEPNINASCGDNLPPETKCWEGISFTRLSIYRILIAVFLGCMGPFAFFNVQKTKYLQLFTSFMRWLAFTVMISLAVRQLITKGPEGHPSVANITGLPALLGASVYSFMCHHSLPGLIAPISGNNHIKRLLALDYGLIASFYLLLSLTGVFAFSQPDELYTLVFNPRCSASDIEDSTFMRFIGYFLALFPVFTLSTSFPIIAITLRNNLQNATVGSNTASYPWIVQRLLFPFLSVIPPVLVALISENLEILVRITGSFAGAGIQYIIPALLVLFARREVQKLPSGESENVFASPFQGTVWVVVVLLWAIACILLVFFKLFLS
ncbi:Transmembrane protein 104-like protein [Frankliniella fusca]|uniref:Transmembrane protein 104-like protein n=1 Tax=Frankliniella fusca TaxID=407009 RepID=A0AAE1L6S8_9NEOP|nr:Transmembrane protein 104-like protein [Frankliniella fusca]